ncbi:hypothetical protein [Methanogenium cariaci]|uniref:hypothetical protein n=1 Tax=Methanogenium cariaci TaxID=2197 RepID=UPI000781A458|nr:hypothetical protein [Methanogenium cariaci]
MPTTADTATPPPEEVPTYYKGEMIPPRAEAARRRAADNAPPVPDVIPHQLHGCRFILVRDRDKRAIEKGWNDKQNYAHDSERLARHINAETNYGVMVAGGLCVLDCDNVIALYDDPPFFSTLMQTFIVKTGRKGGPSGGHISIFTAPNCPPRSISSSGRTAPMSATCGGAPAPRSMWSGRAAGTRRATSTR